MPPDDIRYATANAVLRAATDSDPDSVDQDLRDRAKRRAVSATERWVNRTGRPFHAVRIGATDEPLSWEVHDVEDAISWQPATVILDHQRPLPLDPAEGDVLEVRSGRDSWEDITDERGDSWTLDARRKRLRIFERRLGLTPWDDPNRRFCRLTYRYGPLGETVQITDEGVVESVPPDVREAVAAKAATQLALTDNAQLNIPENGQFASRSQKEQSLEATWESTAAAYSGFSTM